MRKFFLRAFEKKQGLEEAVRDLSTGRHRDDVLEDAIRALELDPAEEAVGFGGYPNVLGIMELDAAFMDGDSRDCDAIAGVMNFLPVRIARRLMQQHLHYISCWEKAPKPSRMSEDLAKAYADFLAVAARALSQTLGPSRGR